MNPKERNDLIEHRISRAKSSIKEVELLVENELFNAAISRLYYACYYAVIALLISKEIKAQTHAGVRQMFGLYFIKTGLLDKSHGKLFSEVFDMRLTGDYDDFIECSKEEVIELLEPAKILIKDIEILIKKNK
jgi:uncharacterized protein (UPF0332 family)